jgi:hypothetical protein
MSSIVLNSLFYSRDYSEYDKPTFLRKHGSVFRERFWKPIYQPRKSRFTRIHSGDLQ